MQSFLSHWGYLALFVLTFAEAAGIPIPSEITLSFGGYLASAASLGSGSHHHLQIVAVILLGTLGEVCGSFVGFAIGRFGGRPLVERVGKYLLITKSDLDRAERWFNHRGEGAVVIGRILPIIRTFVSIAAGIAEMRIVRFAVATTIGSLVWCSALALAGYELGASWHSLTKGFSYAGIILAALAVVAIAAFIVHRYRAVRHERQQETAA